MLDSTGHVDREKIIRGRPMRASMLSACSSIDFGGKCSANMAYNLDAFSQISRARRFARQ